MTAELIAFDTSRSRGGFLGTATIGFPDIGLLIRGISVYEHSHSGEVKRWAEWPAMVSWVDGRKTVSPMIETLDASAAEEFRLLVLNAVFSEGGSH